AITTGEPDNGVAKLLLERKADFKVADNKGQLPLLAAVQRNSFDYMKMLLEVKADPNCKNGEGVTAVGVAFDMGFPLVKLLLGSKATPNVQKGDISLLTHAIQRGPAGSVNSLLDAGAIPTIMDLMAAI